MAHPITERNQGGSQRELNYKAVGIALIPIGLFLIILGAIFLPISVNDYHHAVNASTCATIAIGPQSSETVCSITFADAETLIAESALALSIGITALIGGFLLLRRKSIPQVKQSPRPHSPPKAGQPHDHQGDGTEPGIRNITFISISIPILAKAIPFVAL